VTDHVLDTRTSIPGSSRDFLSTAFSVPLPMNYDVRHLKHFRRRQYVGVTDSRSSRLVATVSAAVPIILEAVWTPHSASYCVSEEYNVCPGENRSSVVLPCNNISLRYSSK
jgi:hypothetical protein